MANLISGCKAEEQRSVAEPFPFPYETAPEEGICFKMIFPAVVAIDPKWFYSNWNPTGASGWCSGSEIGIIYNFAQSGMLAKVNQKKKVKEKQNSDRRV